MIRYCPNCKGNLLVKKYLTQHVKECEDCEARYFQIETTEPKPDIDIKTISKPYQPKTKF